MGSLIDLHCGILVGNGIFTSHGSSSVSQFSESKDRQNLSYGFAFKCLKHIQKRVISTIHFQGRAVSFREGKHPFLIRLVTIKQRVESVVQQVDKRYQVHVDNIQICTCTLISSCDAKNDLPT